MEERMLNLLLIGKTGNGKSATGNTILGRQAFRTGNIISETKDFKTKSTFFANRTLVVVDGPGLEDTNINMAEDIPDLTKKMDNILNDGYGGVDAFLLIIKFGNRFTQDDTDSLAALRDIFGEVFFKHVIVVVTCGDDFNCAMEEEENPHTSFHEWCTAQTDPLFQNLYNDCERRFVLFNNREKDEGKKLAQIMKVVQLAHGLQRYSGRYTRECFKNAESERERLILKLKAPRLNEQFKKKASLLVTSIEELSARPTDDANKTTKARILDLKNEINQLDQRHGILLELLETLTQVQENLDDAEKRVARARKPKNTGVLGKITRCFDY